MQFSRSETTGRWLRVAVVLLALVAVCAIWSDVALNLAGILFGGTVLAFLVLPLARLFEKKLKRPLSAALALAVVGVALILLVALLLPVMIRQFSGVIDLIPEAFSRLRGLAEGLLSRLQERLPDIELPRLNFAGAEKEFGGMAKGAVDYLSGLGDRIYRLTLMIALSYFFIADRERILLRLELLIPSAQRCMMVRTGISLSRELRLYLRGQITIALAVGALAALGMLVIGVPGAPLLGVFVGLFNVIPYFGPIIGGVPAVLTALSVGWQTAALTLAVLFLVQQIDGLVISPRVMGNITGFSPAIVLLALFVGASLGNVFGMIFALPALMSIRTLYRVFVQRHENN